MQSFHHRPFFLRREVLRRRIPICRTTTILPHSLFPSILILDEMLDFLTIHIFHHVICLPFLYPSSQPPTHDIFSNRFQGMGNPEGENKKELTLNENPTPS